MSHDENQCQYPHFASDILESLLDYYGPAQVLAMLSQIYHWDAEETNDEFMVGVAEKFAVWAEVINRDLEEHCADHQCEV
jgi:hypothetical protein